ncbi:TPA: hypothetical protein QCU33_005246 [Bacillus cereus]|nr:hypothetical protein [Bacillus cereus]
MNKIIKHILIAVYLVVVFIFGAIGVYNDEEFKYHIREEVKTKLIGGISGAFEVLGYNKSIVSADAAPSQMSI